MVQSGCDACNAFLKKRRQSLSKETWAATLSVSGALILMVSLSYLMTLAFGRGLVWAAGGALLMLIGRRIAPSAEDKGYLSFHIIGPHTHVYAPSLCLHLEFPINSGSLHALVKGPGEWTARWKAEIDLKNRRVDFIDCEGVRLLFAPFSYGRSLDLIPNIVQTSYSVRDRFDEDRRRIEAGRRLYHAAAATRMFMEETKALKRSEPLRQANDLLLRGMMEAEVPDEWEKDVPAKLAVWREELGLTYGPRPDDEEESV